MIIVVRLSPLAKNVPQRNRAGYQFKHEPVAVDVNDEQLKIIQGDQYLKICNFPSVAWFDALGIERTQQNEDLYRNEKGNYVAPKKMPKTARIGVQVGSEGVDTKEAKKTHPAPTGGQGEGIETPPASKLTVGEDGAGLNLAPKTNSKPIELSASSPVEDLIKALEKKGKKAGKDFQLNAKPESLFALLRTL